MSKISFAVLLMMALSTSMVLAFAPLQATNGRKSTVGLSMAMLTTPPPPPATALEQVFVVQQQQSGSSTTSPMQAGAHAYLASQVDTSSLTLSLQERRPPTPEEIAAKKANFNFWFWGGGFVAPLIATVFYFGPMFWTK